MEPGARAPKSPAPATGNAESNPKDGRLGGVPGIRHNARTEESPRPEDRNEGIQPEDDGPGVASGDCDNACARGDTDIADIDATSQPGGDVPGMVDSSSGAARARRSLDSTHKNAGGSPKGIGLGQEGGDDGGIPLLPGSGGNSGRNPEDRKSDERGEATEAGEFRNSSGAVSPNDGKGGSPGASRTARALGIEGTSHSDGGSEAVRRDKSNRPRSMVGIPAENENASARQSRSWPDTASAGYAYQKDNPGHCEGPPSEGGGSTGSQIEAEVGDISDSGTESTVGERESRCTHDTGTNTSIEGSFGGNFGSHSNYGDRNRRPVNEETIDNQGTILNWMESGGGDRLKIAAAAAREEAPHVPWMVTYSRNEGFTGREDILRRVESQTQMGGHNRVALWGLGGTGKSQIALKYVCAYEGRRPVFWVQGSSLEKFSEKFSEQFMNTIRHTEISRTTIDGKDSESRLASVKKWFESPRSGEWILIVDNADNESDFDSNNSPIAKYLPRGPKGTLIITTRSRLVGSRSGCRRDNLIEVERMRAAEAKQLFLFQYGVLKRREDTRVVGDILRSLRYLPLAVAGGAAYMAETSTTPSQYLKMLRSKDAMRERPLSQEFNDIYREAPTGVAESILSTFFITFKQISERYHQAMDLLRLITFLKDHQNIPEEILRCSGIPGMDDDLTVRETFGKLESFSLVTEKTTSFLEDQSLPVYELHRLVRISAEVYFKEREELDASVWIDRAQRAEKLASQARLPPISPRQSQGKPGTDILQEEQGDA